MLTTSRPPGEVHLHSAEDLSVYSHCGYPLPSLLSTPLGISYSESEGGLSSLKPSRWKSEPAVPSQLAGDPGEQGALGGGAQIPTLQE